MAATAWEFRNKLLAILSAANHSGQPYVDVDSGHIEKELQDDRGSSLVCHDIMTKLMRPGDSILKETGQGEDATMMIRYVLKPEDENKKTENVRQTISVNSF
jgi:hypothetical protein